MVTKFATAPAYCDQLDAMFQSVKQLQPQVFDARVPCRTLLGKHCNSIFQWDGFA